MPEFVKSRGQELAERDGYDAEKIAESFEPFYTMRIWKEAIKDLRDLRGNTFKVAFGQRVKEISAQYSPYDFYQTLKEGVVPEIQRSDLLESVEADLEHMKALNERRERKGKRPKFPLRTIETYEEALNDLRRMRRTL